MYLFNIFFFRQVFNDICIAAHFSGRVKIFSCCGWITLFIAFNSNRAFCRGYNRLLFFSQLGEVEQSIVFFKIFHFPGHLSLRVIHQASAVKHHFRLCTHCITVQHGKSILEGMCFHNTSSYHISRVVIGRS